MTSDTDQGSSEGRKGQIQEPQNGDMDTNSPLLRGTGLCGMMVVPSHLHPMPDWMELAKKYRGKWVAMKPDHKTVAGSGDSFDAALADAKKKGCDEPFLAHIPKTPRYFAGGIR